LGDIYFDCCIECDNGLVGSYKLGVEDGAFILEIPSGLINHRTFCIDLMVGKNELYFGFFRKFGKMFMMGIGI
jgi:hypothetical protein